MLLPCPRAYCCAERYPSLNGVGPTLRKRVAIEKRRNMKGIGTCDQKSRETRTASFASRSKSVPPDGTNFSNGRIVTEDIRNGKKKHKLYYQSNKKIIAYAFGREKKGVLILPKA